MERVHATVNLSLKATSVRTINKSSNTRFQRDKSTIVEKISERRTSSGICNLPFSLYILNLGLEGVDLAVYIQKMIY